MTYSNKASWLPIVALALLMPLQAAYAERVKIGRINIDLPPRTDSSWIMQDVLHNGVKTSLLGLTIYQPLWQSKEHFVQRFSQAGRYREDQHEGWTVLSQKRGRHFVSVQLREVNFGAVGMLTISEDIHDNIDMRLDTLRLPDGFQVLNLLQDDRSETATLSTTKSVAAASQSLTAALAARGWSKQREYSSRGVNGMRLIFKKRSSIVSLFLANDTAWGRVTLIYLNRKNLA